jgi:hypothetical protein
MSIQRFTEVTAASVPTPPAASFNIFFDSADSLWKKRDDAGVLTPIEGGMVNPMTTLGDVITSLALGAPQRLGIGSAGQVLTVTAGEPAWATPAAGGGWSVVTETTATRSAAADEFVLVNVATCTVTLPAPVADVTIAVKAIIATVTDIQIRTSGAGIDIDGTDYSSTGLALSTQYEQVNVISDGTDWFIY